MWTRFMDMHSSGDQKEKWSKIFIEASSDVARVVFYNRFGHSPDRVSCTCCGKDYSYNPYGDDYKTLEEASKFDREEDGWGDNYPKSLEKFIDHKDILIIRDSEIKAHEKEGEVPEEGYVWV